jgi:hypothetical protein
MIRFNWGKKKTGVCSKSLDHPPVPFLPAITKSPGKILPESLWQILAESLALGVQSSTDAHVLTP